MNLFKIIKEINGNNQTLKQKLKNIKNLFQYYYRLEKGISNKTIFLSEDWNSKESKKIAKVFENIDCIIIEKDLTKNIKNFLRKLELKNRIDFKEKKDFLQVGINTLFIQEPFIGLWTTGKATFYLPINNKFKNKIIIEIFSVIPTIVTIGQEGITLGKISMKKIQSKRIELPLHVTNENIVELLAFGCDITEHVKLLKYDKLTNLKNRESLSAEIKTNKKFFISCIRL